MGFSVCVLLYSTYLLSLRQNFKIVSAVQVVLIQMWSWLQKVILRRAKANLCRFPAVLQFTKTGRYKNLARINILRCDFYPHIEYFKQLRHLNLYYFHSYQISHTSKMRHLSLFHDKHQSYHQKQHTIYGFCYHSAKFRTDNMPSIYFSLHQKN